MRLTGVDGMAGTAVVATGCGGQEPVDVPALARSVRELGDTGWNAVLVTPRGAADVADSLTLALGQSRSGRRAVPIVAHTLIDPADPALAHPPNSAFPEPLAVLEAEAIATLVRSGFPVVVSGQVPVVPHGSDYRPVVAALDEAASAQRIAGDLGAAALVFVAGDDRPLSADGPAVAEIDVIEAERRLAGPGGAGVFPGEAPRFGPELRAAVRFLRAGGELAVITTPSFLPAALDGSAGPASPGVNGAAGTRLLRVRPTLARPRSGVPVLAAGWC